MSMAVSTEPSDWDSVTQHGTDIYEGRLKALLEPEHNGRFVAIHVESGDHAVDRFAGGARRALRRTHPDGALVTMKIGPEPEYGLSARLLAARGRVGK